ncbi:MAG: hypothetical protein LBV17_12315 [Treponema sp.]|jgi:hypothetical protein|nr:hypothetical protein [Treponema sp.]
MKERIMIMVICTVIAVGLVMPLDAQQHFKDVPFDEPQSNQVQATAGLFGTSVDDYLNVNYWSGVEFDKGFGYLTGGTYEAVNKFRGDDTNHVTDPFAIDLGYATRLGGVYLGLRYAGNLFQIIGNKEPSVIEESIVVDYPATGWNPITTTTTTDYGEGWLNSTNQIGILLGLGGNIGIKIGFFESLSTNTQNGPAGGQPYIKTVDHQNGSTSYLNKYISYVDTKGHIIPSLGFGINLGGGEGAMAIKPYIDIAFDIYQDRQNQNKKDYIVYDGTTTLDSETITYDAGHNNGIMIPSATIGVNFELPKKESTDITIGIEYGIGIGILSNSYDVGVSGTTNGFVEWTSGSRTVSKYLDRTTTQDNASLTFTDITNAMDHRIKPSFTTTKEIGGLKLGFKAEVPVGLSFLTTETFSCTRTVDKLEYDSEVRKQDNLTRTTNTYGAGDLTEDTEFNIAPVLGIGVSYPLIPGRFTVNAGVSAVPVSFTRKITKKSPGREIKTVIKEVDGLGKTIRDDVTVSPNLSRTDSVKVEDELKAFSGSVTGGFVFSFNDNFSLDLLAGVPLNNSADDDDMYDNAGNLNGTIKRSSANTDGFNINLTTVKVLFTFKF